MTSLAQWLGAAAGVLTTVAFLPQVIKTFRSRSTGDLSGVTFGLFGLGVALWLAYGLMLKLWPVVAANGVTLVLAGALLWAKLRFRGPAVSASASQGE